MSTRARRSRQNDVYMYKEQAIVLLVPYIQITTAL